MLHANHIQLLPADAAAAVAAAAAVPAAAVVWSPSFSSVISPTVPGPSSQRIGAKLPPFPGSKGYVDAPYRPVPTFGSDTDLVTAGSSSILSLLNLLGVGAVPSKSPAIPTPRIAPQENQLTYIITSKLHHLRLRLLMLLYRRRMRWGCAWSLTRGLRLLLLLLLLILPNSSDTSTKLHHVRLRLLLLVLLLHRFCPHHNTIASEEFPFPPALRLADFNRSHNSRI